MRDCALARPENLTSRPPRSAILISHLHPQGTVPEHCTAGGGRGLESKETASGFKTKFAREGKRLGVLDSFVKCRTFGFSTHVADFDSADTSGVRESAVLF